MRTNRQRGDVFERKVKILTRELEKKHGKLYHAIDVIAESEANVKYWKEVSENNRVDVHKRDNQLAEKDLQLSGLQDTIHSLISEGAEKDKEIERLKKELDSNSRDFWKAEAERLKKSIDSRRTA